MEGRISDDDHSRLIQYLKSDPEALDDYMHFVMIGSTMKHADMLGALKNIGKSESSEVLSEDILREIIEHDQQVAAVKQKHYEQQQAEAIQAVANERLDAYLAENPKKSSHMTMQMPKKKTIAKVNMNKITILSGIAACLLVAVVGWLFMLSQLGKPVAQLTDFYKAQWENNSLNQSRTIVTRQAYVLESGLAEIAFDSGAVIVLKAPAEITCTSANGVYLASGSLSAKVPSKANGFTVSTAYGKFVDLGTEFSVNTEHGKGSTCHVISGTVELISQKKNKILLRSGQAGEIDLDGSVNSNIAYNRGIFIRDVPEEDSYASAIYKMDPMIHCSFDNNSFQQDLKLEGCSKIRNTNLVLRGNAANNAIELCGGYFSLPNLPENLMAGPFTICYWVQANRYEELQSIQAVIDDVSENKRIVSLITYFEGAEKSFLAHVMDNNRRHKNLYLGDTTNELPVSINKWYFLAVTKASDNKMTFYVNGINIHDQSDIDLPKKGKLYFGLPMTIVNNKILAVDNFTGMIDEIAVFEHALSAKEINQLFNYKQ